MGYILTTKSITKKFKGKTAVDNVSIHVERGEVYGLIGRNGAGKTTLLKMLAGLAFPTSGTFELIGQNNESMNKMRPRVGVLIEDPGVFKNLDAFSNLKAKALAYGVKDDNYLRELLRFVGLAEVGKKPVNAFSLGMRQRLGIAIAMVNSPEILLLDEPINGLDPQGIAEVRNLIHRLCTEKKITIVISSHILEELSKVANHYGIIHEGKLLAETANTELDGTSKAKLLIKTSDAEKTKAVLAQMGISDYSFDGEKFEIREKIEQSGQLAVTLGKDDVQILEMHKEGQSLEDYYFQLTGGNTDV